MRPEILLIEPMIAPIEASLDANYRVHRLFEAQDQPAFINAIAPQVRAIVTGGGTGASNETIDGLPQVEIIAINGVGTDAVDLKLCRSRGIRVTTTPGVLTEDVADLALGLTLAVLRRLVVNDRFVRQGLWLKETPPLARKVTGKRIGIFGLGQIGRSIARRAEGFNMIIQYTDVRPIEGVSYQYAASLTELAQMSDILVIAASAGPSTKGIVDRAVLDALGSSGVLINVARGSVVNEAELVAALKEKRIAGAGLDVFAEEPRSNHIRRALRWRLAWRWVSWLLTTWQRISPAKPF